MTTSSGGAGDHHRDMPTMTHPAIVLNNTTVTEPHWRQLPPTLRARLRRRLGGKAAILNRPVLAIARSLCARGADDLAFDFYRALQGEPLDPYQGCGLGLLMNLRELMGDDAATMGEMLLLPR